MFEASCPNCKSGLEDTFHALSSCPSLVSVWQVQFVNPMNATGSVSGFIDVIQLAQQDRNHVDLFAMMVSLIWMRRNKSQVGERVFNLEKIPAMACDSLQEFQ